MLVIISPSKTQNFNVKLRDKNTKPRLFEDSLELVSILKKFSADELGDLMSLSRNLADLNFSRYRDFRQECDEENSRCCIDLFKGNVYDGINIGEFEESEELSYLQSNLRIISGLYGLLRPFDSIQPYRLEMKTRLENNKGFSLYDFWGDKITEMVNEDLNKVNSSTLVNLASNEYYKSIKKDLISANIIDIAFKEKKGDKYKIVMAYAKKARGLMAKYIIKNKINSVEGIKSFDLEGYSFNKELSGKEFVFTR